MHSSVTHVCLPRLIHSSAIPAHTHLAGTPLVRSHPFSCRYPFGRFSCMYRPGKRAPSWPDRILWRSSPSASTELALGVQGWQSTAGCAANKEELKGLDSGAAPVAAAYFACSSAAQASLHCSHHRPVGAAFTMQMRPAPIPTPVPALPLRLSEASGTALACGAETRVDSSQLQSPFAA